MDKIVLSETFDGPSIDKRLTWYCEPRKWDARDGLNLESNEMTDYWQKTRYGFENDNGHFLFFPHAGNLELTTHVIFSPVHQYDQAGLMIRASSQHWVKTSVEYEPGEDSQLGAVVTTQGYSDWSMQSYPSARKSVSLRMRFEDEVVTVWYSNAENGEKWSQIRMAPFALPPGGELQCGLYACSPTGGGFKARFTFLEAKAL